MIRYKDAWNDDTTIDIIPVPFNDRINLIIGKQKRVVYESWDLKTACEILKIMERAVADFVETKANQIQATLKESGES